MAEHYRDNIHDDVKLVLAPDTPFEIRRRGGRYRAAVGQLIALHGDDTHSGGPLEPEAANEVRWVLMCLSSDTVADAGVRGPLRIREPVVRDAGLSRRYRQLYGVLESPASTLAKEVAVMGFVRALARYGSTLLDEPGQRDPASDRPARIRRARALLGERVDRNVALAELAAIADLTTHQVVRAFIKEYGLPPHVLHLRLRLDRAQRLLRHGEPLAEVAYATGFADQAHFTRTFRRIYGTTPGRYQRRSLRGSDDRVDVDYN